MTTKPNRSETHFTDEELLETNFGGAHYWVDLYAICLCLILYMGIFF